MSVLAVDPGKDTGWRWCIGGLVMDAEEDPADVFVDRLEYCRASVVVCEDYDITGATLKKSRSERAWSIEQIGVLRMYARRWGAEFVLQRVADAKRLVTDDRLKQLGLWKPTRGGHANDATRHLVMYLAKRGEMRIPT